VDVPPLCPDGTDPLLTGAAVAGATFGIGILTRGTGINWLSDLTISMSSWGGCLTIVLRALGARYCATLPGLG